MINNNYSQQIKQHCNCIRYGYLPKHKEGYLVGFCLVGFGSDQIKLLIFCTLSIKNVEKIALEC